MEIFVLYEKSTGFIKGCGRFNRLIAQASNDGSSALEIIQSRLQKHSNWDVFYLPDQDLPVPKKVKVLDKKFINLSEKDLEWMEANRVKTPLELLEARVSVLEG